MLEAVEKKDTNISFRFLGQPWLSFKTIHSTFKYQSFPYGGPRSCRAIDVVLFSLQQWAQAAFSLAFY
jgi:hypothetical protein